MIRSDKFINIKSEYPNYFLDTLKFIKELKDIIEKVKEGKIQQKTQRYCVLLFALKDSQTLKPLTEVQV